jgi:menaquinone-dependent protoporphyrinogen IX oxidase
MRTMEILLLYSSQTGFTRRYAQWIGEALGIDPVALKDLTQPQLAQADLIIYGGSINGGLLTGQAKVQRMVKKAGGKPVLWFATGLRPATPRTLELVRKNNFPWGEEAPLFYFPGGSDWEALSPGDRTLLHVYRAMLRRRGNLHPEDRQVTERMTTSGDYTDPSAIVPLLHWVQALEQAGS